MATGYTHDLPPTLKAFALRCARAFGALIEMRDEALDAKIPTTFKPDPYRRDRAAEILAEIKAVEAWDARAAEAAAQADAAQAIAAWDRAGTVRRDMAAKYDAMLAKVNAWSPPTKDHMELKRFMREQLVDSRKFDCGPSTWPRPVAKSGAEFKVERLAKLRKDEAYHREEYARDVARAAERTAWVKALRESL